MQKCIDFGKFTCVNHSGLQKKKYKTDKIAIATAKLINNRENNPYTKLVAYKCSYCNEYHLTTHLKRIRKADRV